MKRTRIYVAVLNWTSPLLFVLVWLQLPSGLGRLKGPALQMVTLGLMDATRAARLHTVSLPLALGILTVIHATLGLQMLGRRLKWVRRKTAWEVGAFAIGALGLLQFLALYLA